MEIADIIGVASAIVASLGGGSVIVAAVSKWCGDIIAHKMLISIEQKHEKEIERYKTTLKDMSSKYNALLEQSVDIFAKQYDVEFEIYRNIWKILYELTSCAVYINDFLTPEGGDSELYIKKLNEHCLDIKNKLALYHEMIDSNAPFYQDNIYEMLCKIKNLFSELLKILENSTTVKGITDNNKNQVQNINHEIMEYKEQLTKNVRVYLSSLKKMPNEI